MPIQTEHLSYTYKDAATCPITAVSDVNINIADGEFVGIMGRTGCGKTTLAQLITGLLTPNSGKVLLDGEDINSSEYDRGSLRKKIGIVFQYPEYQLFETTVEKDVAFGLKYSGLSREETTERVKQALELMDFSYADIRTQSPLSLSGGEKRRVAIAGVLAVKPKILVFDEPVAGLDPLGREAFLKLVCSLNDSGTTIIMISHNADAISEYAKRIIVLENGRVELDGSPKEVFGDSGRMRKLRLGVSTPKEISEMLFEKGFDIPKDTVKYEQLINYLIKDLTKGEKE